MDGRSWCMALSQFVASIACFLFFIPLPKGSHLRGDLVTTNSPAQAASDLEACLLLSWRSCWCLLLLHTYGLSFWKQYNIIYM